MQYTIREGNWEYTDKSYRFIKSINYDESRYVKNKNMCVFSVLDCGN